MKSKGVKRYRKAPRGPPKHAEKNSNLASHPKGPR